MKNLYKDKTHIIKKIHTMTDQVSELEPVIEKLTGLKLYNAFKKTLPKGLSREEVSQKWIDHKISLGMEIKVKVPKVPKVKVPKVPKEKKIKVPKIPKIEKDKKTLDDGFNELMERVNLGGNKPVFVMA